MNSPRIRHLVQPPMSVVDRNLSITNEVRTIMTTTALPTQSARRSAIQQGGAFPQRSAFPQQGLELLVSRLAVSMLRWSQHRSARRRVTHEEMMLLRQIQKDSATAIDLARLNHLG
jgi:hypothetical protein